MFTFFGLFADHVSDLSEQISRTWPHLNIIKLERPISAIAVRFGERDYSFADEGMLPEPVTKAIEELSRKNAAVRFLLLRTECFGGRCDNWGRIIQNGTTVFRAEGDGALRDLVKYWGVDLGPQEIFDPLRRDFQWDSSSLQDR
jgi:hypothetical protein